MHGYIQLKLRSLKKRILRERQLSKRRWVCGKSVNFKVRTKQKTNIFLLSFNIGMLLFNYKSIVVYRLNRMTKPVPMS